MGRRRRRGRRARPLKGATYCVTDRRNAPLRDPNADLLHVMGELRRYGGVGDRVVRSDGVLLAHVPGQGGYAKLVERELAAQERAAEPDDG